MFADPARAAPLGRAAAVRGWVAGGSVYFGGVIGRTSLGVAGLVAARRFGISPAQLSVFVVLQVGVYTAMQIPTGILVDRYGSRRLLLWSAVLISISGFAFALIRNYPTALAARTLLGCGDAMTFVSVLRYAAANFAPRRYPQVVALTALFPLAGSVAATAPLSFVLHNAGWAATFVTVAILSALGGVAVALFMPPPSRPAASSDGAAVELGDTRSRLKYAWRTPGTRLGFWVHFSCMAMPTMFALLWGLPYLVSVGFSNSVGGVVLLLFVISGTGVVLSIGSLIAARPSVRVPIAFGVSLFVVVSWTGLLTLGGNHPSKVVVAILTVLMGAVQPVASVGFAIVRDHNLPSIVGTASGIVNGAGFFAGILCVSTVGLTLQLVGNTGPAAFRLAFGTALVIQAFGLFRLAVWDRRVRANVRRGVADGAVVPVSRRRWSPAGAVVAAVEVPPEPQGRGGPR